MSRSDICLGHGDWGWGKQWLRQEGMGTHWNMRWSNKRRLGRTECSTAHRESRAKNVKVNARGLGRDIKEKNTKTHKYL